MTVEAFPRFEFAGTAWLHDAPASQRAQLLPALVSRFNHDLRTPLNTIAGWAHLLKAGDAEVAQVRHVADVLARNVRDQTALLGEFVDDARAILDALVLHPANVAASEVVSAAAARLALALELHGLQLRTSMAPDLRLNADLARTQRLLYRLLHVAVRRAPEASEVRLGVAEDDPCLEFMVDAPTAQPAFEEAALLDLRIASMVTAAARGTLDIGRPDGGTHLLLRLPLATE